MSETKKRKVHLPEFKAKVGQRKKAIQEQARTMFEGKQGPAPVAGSQ